MRSSDRLFWVCRTSTFSEHEHVVERRPPALAPVRPRHRALEFAPEPLEVDHGRQPLEVVTPSSTVRPSAPRRRKIPPADPCRSSPLHPTVEQITRLAQVFGGVHLSVAAGPRRSGSVAIFRRRFKLASQEEARWDGSSPAPGATFKMAPGKACSRRPSSA